MIKKHVLIFQSGEPLPCDFSKKRKMRAWNLVDELLSKHCKITLVGARFDHSSKVHRDGNYFDDYHKNLKIYLINSPGYKKNISFSRLFDHIVLSWNLFIFLKNFKSRPDVVYIGFPPIESAFITFAWARKMNSSIFFDVKDLWPEIFTFSKNKLKRSFLKACLFPYYFMYRYMVKNTDYLVSISQEFIDYLIKDTNRNSDNNIVSFLTSHEYRSTQTINKQGDALNIGFAGNFMDAFDFRPVRDALNNLNNHVRVKLLIAGDGGMRSKVEEIFRGCENVTFLGWLDGEILEDYFQNIDLCLIPLKQRLDFSMSFPNKAMDALSRSKPILCSCSGTLTTFLRQNKCGFYYDPNSTTDLANILNHLFDNKTELNLMAKNIEGVFNTRFNHKKNYMNLSSKILE